MLKYYLLMFFVLAIALLYAYLADPCNRMVRLDFAAKYPTYEILDSNAQEGSPESVRCVIRYRKPDSEEVFEDVWLYQNRKKKQGWEFSRILETREGESSR